MGSDAGALHWQLRGGEDVCCALAVGCGSDRGNEEEAPQAQLQAVEEVLSSCSRQVTGSLADVAGLLPIKQLLREVRWP